MIESSCKNIEIHMKNCLQSCDYKWSNRKYSYTMRCKKFLYWPNNYSDMLTRLTQQVPLVEQELLTLMEHLISSQVFSGVRVTQSLIVCIYFVDRCLSFSPFTFSHCVVCSSSIYGFWLSLSYIQTLLKLYKSMLPNN